MRVLLTNDDGYDAAGLAALCAAVRLLPDVAVTVVASSAAQSEKGHVVSARFRFWTQEAAGLGPVTVVEGSPADCVRAALIVPDLPRPDLVISGINHGSNLGVDIYNSGTVAAVREAGILGVPGVAVSQLVKRPIPDDWNRGRREAAGILAAMLQPDRPCPAGADAALHAQTLEALSTRDAGEPPVAPGWWNVNLPCLPPGEAARGVKLTRISRDPPAMDYRVIREEAVAYCENLGRYHTRPASPGTDVAAVFAGWVSISPLRWCDYR